MDKPTEQDRRFAELMGLSQEGDTVAYVTLLREVRPLLERSIRQKRPFLQSHDVEDLVQNILLALHSVRATYDPTRPFLPWLVAIMRHRIADAARRHVRRGANETIVEQVPETFSDDGTNIYGDAYGDPEALRAAVNTRPPGQRRAIEMLKLREMTLKEAAAVSGMSITAIYSPDVARNLDTVRPLAAYLGVEITITPRVSVLAAKDIAKEILSKHAGGAVIYVGNVTGNLYAVYHQLGGPGTAPEEYGDLAILTVPDQGPVKVERRRFGP